ncbi:hypothetical protein Tsubulata_005029 [Turnera subulata]|uniref:squalene monooxygenase n=1 Tax=Turnera subulata TaxID=218843 RepID=A0A9Q0FAY3_9ROSI|nr:hypothetical protein Tsubulata_005029 [Turnera subulata]
MQSQAVLTGETEQLTKVEVLKFYLWKMDYEFIMEGIVAFLLGLVFLYKLRGRRNTKALVNNLENETLKSSTNGMCQPEDMAKSTDIIIVGAGVAGSALAYTLAKDGRQVHVIERDLNEPDRIVGELLQPGGYLKLIELGLEDCVDDIDAQRVFGYALFKDGKSTKLSYPLGSFRSDVSGRSFHNGRFIQKMRNKAATLPNVRLEQGTVTSLLEEKGTVTGVQYKTSSGQVLKAYAPLTIVCDGCFSNLRRSLCNPKVDIPSCFVALVLENCNLPYPNHGHVILADPSPILMYPISSTEVRCLVDIPGQKVPSISNGEMTKYLKNTVASQIPPELYSAFMATIEKGNIKTMPNRSMPASPCPTPGALLLGDAFNMRHPLTGGGMTVALSDIVLLRNLLRPIKNLHDASSLCMYLESFYTLRKGASSIIFPIIKAEGDQPEEKADECTDIIIVGAGVAGSALAYALAKDGRHVHVIERDLNEPDRIVGELLQPGGYLKLMELGLEDCVEDIDSQRVYGYALFKDGKSTKLSYPLESFHSDVSGRSFHHGRFVQKMRNKAATLPNVRLEQGTVTSLVEVNGTVKGVQYRTSTGQTLKAYAPLTIVCDGCFSNLRRSLCNPKVDIPSCFVALALENCKLPYPNHGHVVLADPSPILMYPISSTEVRCLVDVPGQKVPSISNGEMTQYLKTTVARQMPSELYSAFMTAVEKGNMRTMANRSMPASPYPTPGALLLGDAFNMRHPLTGGGMTVALSDPVASTINTLAGALYKVFSASPDPSRKEMRQACFDYLSLGGVCSNGPIALLSGLNPRPLSLVLHFFAVAIFGLSRLLLPFPSPKNMWIGARLISGASGIIFPIIKGEGIRQMFFPVTMPPHYRLQSTLLCITKAEIHNPKDLIFRCIYYLFKENM